MAEHGAAISYNTHSALRDNRSAPTSRPTVALPAHTTRSFWERTKRPPPTSLLAKYVGGGRVWKNGQGATEYQC